MDLVFFFILKIIWLCDVGDEDSNDSSYKVHNYSQQRRKIWLRSQVVENKVQ